LSFQECLDRACTLGSRVFPEARVNADIPFTLSRLCGAGLWIGVDKMLAPFRETVKI
jgi:hypothetical protein